MATVGSNNNNLRRSSRKRGNSEISHQSEPSLKTEEDSAGSSSEQLTTTSTAAVPTEVANGVEKKSESVVAAAAVGPIKSENPPIKNEEGNASSASDALEVKPAPKAPMSAGEAAMAAAAKSDSAAVSVPKAAAAQSAPQTVVGKANNAQHVVLTTPPPKPSSPPPPLKALTFHHLQKKYGAELGYMLVEFRKLERQLLGAPAAAAKLQQQKPEAAGSKERREKLHGFILHLDDTIRQVSEGCQLEVMLNRFLL